MGNENAKSILCFGDSLTWGHNPDGVRHPYAHRWTGVLEATLGRDKVRIIEEGLGGRTTVFDDNSGPSNLNGAHLLPTLLGSHQPLDAVIIMLGTNDLKNHVCGNVQAIARGVGRLVQIVQTFAWWGDYATPEIILVSPPHCVKANDPVMRGIFDGAIEKSRHLSSEIRRVAGERNVHFFDAASVATASPIDGVHLNAASTRAIGEALAPLVADILDL